MYDETRLDVLLDAYFDQELTAAERRELEKMLLASARAREIFWERAQHHSAIRQWGMQEWGRKVIEENPEPLRQTEIEPEQKSPPRSNWFARFGWWGWSTAVAASVALLLMLHDSKQAREISSYTKEAPDSGVAVITRAAGVVWDTSSNEPESGVALKPGWLRLKQGIVNLEFYSGARLIVEGPAEVQLVSPMEAFCKYGKLSATVPEQAHGFKVRSPQMDVVDLGTAFGLDVPVNGQSEVHVFKGEIELTRAGAQSLNQKLFEGQALQVNNTGELNEIQSRPRQFVNLRELEERERLELGRRFETWKTANATIDADPATLVHYTFEGEPNGDRAVFNSARNPASATQGSIVSCEWSSGRWPAKSALEFKSRSDRVRLGIPGNHEALTYMAWVRVDSLPRPFNGLLLSDDLGVGEVRWELSHTGEIRFGMRVAPKIWERAISPTVITPDRFGQWIYLATVVDVKNHTVRHYVDGKQVAMVQLKRTVPIKLGNVELGNWGVRADNPQLMQNDEAYITRPFTGRIDEFTLSSRAFSADEIQQRYLLGKPAAAVSVASAK